MLLTHRHTPHNIGVALQATYQRARIPIPQLDRVIERGTHHRVAIVIERDGIDEIRVPLQRPEQSARGRVPELNGLVTGRARQDTALVDRHASHMVCVALKSVQKCTRFNIPHSYGLIV